jgi:signal transduction histidine kinase
MVGVHVSGLKSECRRVRLNKLPHRSNNRVPTWIGFILLGVVAVRSLIFYREQPALPAVIILLATFGLLLLLEPVLSARFSRFPFLYFPLQTAVLLTLSGQQPFLDIIQALYILLGLQALYTFPFRLARFWFALFAFCLNTTLILAIGWLEGLAFSLLVMAACTFLFSYDRLSVRMQRDKEESERLLAELQQAHQKLQEHAGQAEALAAARERNRLARELHDSVSQTIFAITLTSQTARLLLTREPACVPEQLNHLQEMTAAALGQLRSLIAQLRPPPTG